MNTEKIPLIQKLILGVLVLILVCLALILARTYRRSEAPMPTVAAAEPEDAFPDAREEVRQILSTNARAANPAIAPRPIAPERAISRGDGMGKIRLAEGTVDATLSPQRASAFPAAYTTLVAPLPVSGQPNPGVAEPAPAGGRIFGRVFLSGTPRPETPISMDATCGRLWARPPTTRHYIVGQDKGLANVLVYVKAGIGPMNLNPNEPEPVLENIRCFFEPYVRALQAGQKVKFANADSVLYNVHATPKLNHGFNFSIPSPGHSKLLSFTKPELSIQIKCDVHPWEFAYVHVVDHPFFAVTDTNGVFALPEGLPAGRYLVSALHLKAGETVQEVEIKDGENQNMDFVLNAAR